MALRLVLLRHGATAATRDAPFGDDGPLTERAVAACGALRLPRRAEVRCSPAAVAVATADALGVEAVVDAALADWDLGAWRGRTLDDVGADDPAALAAWLGDPGAAPPGGERLLDVLARVERWLATVAAARDAAAAERARRAAPIAPPAVVAITHATIVRAAVVAALDAPPTAFWALDVAPLATTELHHRDGRWRIAYVNRAASVPAP